MSQENPQAKLLGLDKTLARLAVLVPEKHPRTEEYRVAVGMVKRPFWSNIEGWSLIGGKVDDRDIQRANIFPRVHGPMSVEEIKRITRFTALRETWEETGILTRLDELNFMGIFQNGQWVTALFYIVRGTRPSVVIRNPEGQPAEIDGFQWDDMEGAAKAPSTFADHGLLLEAIAAQVLASDRPLIEAVSKT